MADPMDFLALLAGPQDEAMAQSAALARRLRGQQDMALLGAAGSHRGLSAMAAVDQAQAKQTADLAEKAAATRLHYGADRLRQQHEAKLEESRAKSLMDIEREKQRGANALARTIASFGRPEPTIKQDAEGYYHIIDQNTGKLTPTGIKGELPSERKSATQKTLTAPEVNSLIEADTLLGNVRNLKETFQPTYAGTGWKGDLPVMLEHALGGKDRSNWWAQYRQHIENIQRHKLFGSAFTASEKRAWEQSRQIRPGSSPEVVANALNELETAMARHLQKRVKGREAEGYSAEALKEYAGTAMESPARAKVKKYNPETGAVE